MIIVSTDTPEFISPSTATVLQNRLGAQKAGTFDINSALCRLCYSPYNSSKFYPADVQYRKVLVVGAYAMSKYLNHQDKKTVTLFADGAGAFVLEASGRSRQGFLGGEMRAMGQYNEWMGIYAGGS
ncbi:3-oxoacyl-ACP synthase III family protein [Okeania hirsuta]|uniref:3-oxoacyl-ACP synthase III family protein n=1 Tax=Okeania hirsuta TaxID=1458930 RepID=UPI0019619CAF|nr:hypothetical protein [Okeania hirsuta]